MKAKQKEFHRVAEFGVHKIVAIPVVLGKKVVTTCWELDHRKDGIRARFVARGSRSDETMHDVFAPSSTPSTRCIIDYSSLKKSYHLCISDVPNAYFHVDEDEECCVEPRDCGGKFGIRALATCWNALDRFHGRTL